MMFIPRWEWSSEWGGWLLGAIGGIALLVILAIPWFFFLLNLQNLLNRIEPRNRAMSAGHVWLNFIPIFNLGWFLYTVVKIKESVEAEYRSRNRPPENDTGYNVGLVTGVLGIASFFLGWIPVLGWGMAIAQLICWVLYWLKTSELKEQLGGTATRTWGHGAYAGPHGVGSPRAGSQGHSSGPTYPAASTGPPPYAQQSGEPGYGSGVSDGYVSPEPPPFAEAALETSTPDDETPAHKAEVPTSETGACGEESTEADTQRTSCTCAVCGTEYLPGDNFCRICGLRLPQ